MILLLLNFFFLIYWKETVISTLLLNELQHKLNTNTKDIKLPLLEQLLHSSNKQDNHVSAPVHIQIATRAGLLCEDVCALWVFFFFDKLQSLIKKQH